MAISISANKRSIKNIFNEDVYYVIPEYQRPYSWERDHCIQLFDDIVMAFEEENDYFLGIIIQAMAENKQDECHIVDGQQRLITLWLLLKNFNLMFPEISTLQGLIEKSYWDGTRKECKIKSYSLESEANEQNEDSELFNVYSYTLNDLKGMHARCPVINGVLQADKIEDRVERNFIILYDEIMNYFDNKSEDEKRRFIKFFLENVYLLPVEMKGKDLDEANDNALVFFETINNRGMSLEDADIFKAKLYKDAKNYKAEHEFVLAWQDFKEDANRLGYSVDDVFRFYSHIVRGKNKISTNEKKLREFFINDSCSPLLTMRYDEVMKDLMKVLDALRYINNEKCCDTEVSAWLHILYAYSNTYPIYAVVAYIYSFGIKDEVALCKYMRTLTRYVYAMGSTSSVKFEIYSLIKSTMNHWVHSLKMPYEIYGLLRPSRIRVGLLMINELLHGNYVVKSCKAKRLMDKRMYNSLNPSFQKVSYNELSKMLGNFALEGTENSNIPVALEIIENRNGEINENLRKFFLPNG